MCEDMVPRSRLNAVDAERRVAEDKLATVQADAGAELRRQSARIAELEAVVRLAVESQQWDGNNPDDNHWREFYATARAVLAKGAGNG